MSLSRKMARRKNGAKPNGKGAPDLFRKPEQSITLQNPVQNQFPAFIFGNACSWEQLAMEELQRKAPDAVAALAAHGPETPRMAIMAEFRQALVDHQCDQLVAVEDSAKGQHLLICGAGPSLRETIDEYRPRGDQCWGCNSAIIYLYEHGHRPTHGFSVDQTAETLGEWSTTPDVEYLIASTVHPHLTELLMGRGRRIRFFHNYVGIRRAPVDCGDGEIMAYEDWLYAAFFPPTIRAGSGLNSVNRAIDVALFMGFEKITILGADCAMRFTKPCPAAAPGSPEHTRWLTEEVEMHANGGHGLAANSTALTLSGFIDGREWLTKPDMIISAVWLEKVRQMYKGRIELVGDTLPNALRGKPDSYLRKLPALVDSKGVPLPFS